MALHTLDKMDQGGIHDHVAQGFARYSIWYSVAYTTIIHILFLSLVFTLFSLHRYSTDKQWHVPHFEKMLYDQAQLVHAYLDAYLATGRPRYAEVVRDILTYVMRDLSHMVGEGWVA